MKIHNSKKLVGFLLLFPAFACATDVPNIDFQNTVPEGTLVKPRSVYDLGIEAPKDSYGIQEVDLCAMAGAKAVQTFNIHMHSVDLPSGDRLLGIGEGYFVKYGGCYRNAKNMSEIVISMTVGTKRQVEQDQKTKSKTPGTPFSIVFNEELDVLRWGYKY